MITKMLQQQSKIWLEAKSFLDTICLWTIVIYHADTPTLYKNCLFIGLKRILQPYVKKKKLNSKRASGCHNNLSKRKKKEKMHETTKQ